MGDEEDFDNNPPSLVEQVAENMAIYASGSGFQVVDSELFMPQAEQLVRSFEAIEGRPAADYLEIEEWSMRHMDAVGAKFLVLSGGKKLD